MDANLKQSVRIILYRENGKATVSHILKSLRNKGYTKLGPGDHFVQICEEGGFTIEHRYRERNGIRVHTRTYIALPEPEIA